MKELDEQKNLFLHFRPDTEQLPGSASRSIAASGAAWFDAGEVEHNAAKIRFVWIHMFIFFYSARSYPEGFVCFSTIHLESPPEDMPQRVIVFSLSLNDVYFLSLRKWCTLSAPQLSHMI